jgi:hypothetical protein
LLTSQLNFASGMSCTYIKGSGFGITSVLVNYPNLNSVSQALYVTTATDLIIADITLDRTNSSWWTPGYTCSLAFNYPTTTFNSSGILSTQQCVTFFAYKIPINLPNTNNHAIKVTV